MCQAAGESTDEGNLAPKVVEVIEFVRAISGDLMPVASANRKKEVCRRVASERECTYSSDRNINALSGKTKKGDLVEESNSEERNPPASILLPSTQALYCIKKEGMG